MDRFDMPGMRFIPRPNRPLNFSGLRTAAAVAAAAAIAGGKFDWGGEFICGGWDWGGGRGGWVGVPLRFIGNSSRRRENERVRVAGKRRNCWRIRSSSSRGMIVQRVITLLLRFGNSVEVEWWGGGGGDDGVGGVDCGVRGSCG